MIKNFYFQIADHMIHLVTPEELLIMDYLPSFKDFLIQEPNVDEPIIVKVRILLESPPIIEEEIKTLTNQSSVWGDGFCFEESKSSYITSMIAGQDNIKVSMVSNRDFSDSTIYLNGIDESQRTIISWFMMVAFGQGVLLYDTVLIHASTVERNQEEAYAFLGKSGTGKSTHSQLWLKHLDGFSLLNDDNPAIRIFDDNSVYIYGTPWSGKVHCYRSLKVKLRGVVRLSQAKRNFFEMKSNKESLLMLLPSCTAIRWNMKLFNSMVNTIELVCRNIPVGYMECMINSEAAIMSNKGIRLIN